MFLRIIFLLHIFIISIYADNNATKYLWIEQIDRQHKIFSQNVVELFDNIDMAIGKTNQKVDQNIYGSDFLENQKYMDSFFKSDKFIQENEESFIRLRLGSILQTKESIDFRYKIRAQIPLVRAKDRFQLFIEDMQERYFNKTTPIKPTQNDTDVGIRYLAPDYKGIKSNYSVGVSSLSGYVKARYLREFKFEKWIIEPTQEFKYSFKSDWSEQTNIFFDRLLSENSIFRTTLHRKTQAHINGFDYALALSYYLTLSQRKGFSIEQQFWGNSKYVCSERPSRYNGISDYSTFISWRQNIFRKWITYEIKPGISFHRQYDYEPNYIIHFYIDLYFGNI